MSYDVAGIISGVRTTSELSKLLRELEMLENSLYKTGDQGFEETLQHGVNSKLSEAIQAILQNAENSTNQENRKELIEEIKHGVNGLKIIKIDIPIEPSESMIKKLHKWIIENTGTGRIMEISVDKNIIGGARVTFEGKFADCTLDKIWADVWLQIKTEMGVSPMQKPI